MTEFFCCQKVKRTLLSTLGFLAGWIASGIGQDFELREELGRAWNHECVTIPLTAEQLGKTKAKRPLLDDEGRSVPWQVIQGLDGKPRIAFLVDLAAHTTASFRFGEGGGIDAGEVGVLVRDEDLSSVQGGCAARAGVPFVATRSANFRFPNQVAILLAECDGVAAVVVVNPNANVG